MSSAKNSLKISYVSFFCTLIVVLFTLTPIIFPALFSSYFGMFTENLNPFELGHQSIFLIVSNVVIFGFGIAYYKKKIPSLVYDVIEISESGKKLDVRGMFCPEPMLKSIR
ncbi:MAG: hypothetical protein VB584_00130 [Candidatus Nitrosopelagicus sp.]|jgi:hypothetical protein